MTADEAKPEPRARRMALDPELQAMQDILDALTALEYDRGPDAAHRVLDFVNRRWQTRPAPEADGGKAQ